MYSYAETPQKFPLIFCPLLNILLHLDYYFYNKFNRANENTRFCRNRF
nr:MAG TPA: hypothetical protein [Caudoviricetes sp.]